MSIEANTCEELTIQNRNDKTTAVAKAVSDYLKKTWGIINLSLDVDGTAYNFSDDKIEPDSELAIICDNLSQARNIKMFLRSCNAGGASWRTTSCFLSMLDNDSLLTPFIEYRSIDYYDSDPEIEMMKYDEKGLWYPDYDNSFDDIKDIKRWYAYSPDITIEAEDECENEELHQQLIKCLKKLQDVDEEYDFEDDWEDYGEIVPYHSLAFTNNDIQTIKAIFQDIYDLVKDIDSVDYTFSIYAVPDGENDYDFASICFILSGGLIQTKYCRF